MAQYVVILQDAETREITLVWGPFKTRAAASNWIDRKREIVGQYRHEYRIRQIIPQDEN